MIEEIQPDGTRVKKTLNEVRSFLETIDVDMIGNNPPPVLKFSIGGDKLLAISVDELEKVNLRKLKLKGT